MPQRKQWHAGSMNNTDAAIADVSCQILLTMSAYRPSLIGSIGALNQVGKAIQEKWRSSVAQFAVNIRKLTVLFAEGAADAERGPALPYHASLARVGRARLQGAHPGRSAPWRLLFFLILLYQVVVINYLSRT